MDWLVSLILGAIGGNLAGFVLKGKSLGTLWNSVVGILGGGIGAFILGALGVGTSGASWLWMIIAALIGGGVLLWIVSLFKK